MSTRESLSFVSSSPVRLRVLRAAAEPSTLDELVETLPHSRPPIRDALNWYVDHGWLHKQDTGYRQTAIGASVLQHLGGSLSCEEIQFICDSPVRFSLLHHSALPNTASALTGYCDADSTTAGRMMEKLVDRGWYEREGEYNMRTGTGTAAHTDLVHLIAVLDQLAEHRPLFDRLPIDLADLPVTALAGANDFAPSGGPDAALRTLKQLNNNTASDGSLDRIRTVCPVYRSTSISTMREYVSFETRSELLFDQPTFRDLCAPEQWPVLGGLVAHPHTTVRVYPGDLTFGIGTYDDQGMISAYNDYPGNVAGVASADEEVVDWIDSTIDAYWRRSQPVSDELTNKLSKYADTSLWSVSSTMMWGANDQDKTASAMLYDLITP